MKVVKGCQVYMINYGYFELSTTLVFPPSLQDEPPEAKAKAEDEAAATANGACSGTGPDIVGLGTCHSLIHLSNHLLD